MTIAVRADEPPRFTLMQNKLVRESGGFSLHYFLVIQQMENSFTIRLHGRGKIFQESIQSGRIEVRHRIAKADQKIPRTSFEGKTAQACHAVPVDYCAHCIYPGQFSEEWGWFQTFGPASGPHERRQMMARTATYIQNSASGFTVNSAFIEQKWHFSIKTLFPVDKDVVKWSKSTITVDHMPVLSVIDSVNPGASCVLNVLMQYFIFLM